MDWSTVLSKNMFKILINNLYSYTPPYKDDVIVQTHYYVSWKIARS